MKLLLLVWLLFMVSTSFWMPAYDGDLGGEAVDFVPFYFLVAALAWFGVRKRMRSPREAVISTLPVVGIMLSTVAAGILSNEFGAEYRGSPLYLYFGITICTSWTAMVLSSALVARTRWNDGFGIGAGVLVAMIGLVMLTAQID